MKDKTKRQAMQVSIKQLRETADDLEKQEKELNASLGLTFKKGIDLEKEWLIGIINKTPKQSDTWRLE